MRHKIKSALLALTLIVGLCFIPGRAFAGTGFIYISPGTVNAEINGTFSVQLRINPGTSVNAVQATVSFNTSALQLLSTSLGAFSTCTQNSASGGTVSLACAMLGSSTSSDSLIDTITLKALAGSGSTPISVSGNAASSGTYTNPSVSGATINFYSPAPAPAPAPTTSQSQTYTSAPRSSSTPPSSSSPAPSPSATPTTTPPPPVVSFSAKSISVQFTGGLLSIRTNIPVKISIIYGTSQQTMNQTSAQTSLGTKNVLDLGNGLTPGTTYYYQIIATDGNGNITKGPVGTFTTKGYTISVTVLDNLNHPIPDQSVTLHSSPMVSQTNSKGVATFTNVAPGIHHLEYVSGGKIYSEVVYVVNDVTGNGAHETAKPQTAAVVFANYTYKPKHWNWMLTVIIGAILVAFALGFSRFSFIGAAIKLRHGFHAVKGIKPVRTARADGSITQPSVIHPSDKN